MSLDIFTLTSNHLSTAMVFDAQMSLIDEEVDEGGPRGEYGSLDAALAEKLLSKRALQDQLLHLRCVFGCLQRHRHRPTGLVVYLRVRIKR